MANFKPQMSYSVGSGKYESIAFKDYKEAVSKLNYHLGLSEDGIVTICRSRRNEWGEWLEHWQVVDGKKQIVKQGWN